MMTFWWRPIMIMIFRWSTLFFVPRLRGLKGRSLPSRFLMMILTTMVIRMIRMIRMMIDGDKDDEDDGDENDGDDDSRILRSRF